jgi:monovalent cation/proton antiporter MnhG/PhaG subunit
MGVSVGDMAVDVLLAIGVASVLMSALGLLATRDAYDQLHFTGPATVIGPVAIAAAVLVEEPLSSAGIKAVLVALIMLGTGPVLVHATAKAAWVREHGRWVVGADHLKAKEHPSKSSKP